MHHKPSALSRSIAQGKSWATFLAIFTFGIPAWGQPSDLVSCVKGLTDLGITADQALQACQQQNICQCDSPQGSTAVNPEASGTTPTATTGDPLSADAVTDIAGVFGETEIKQLVELGIIEVTTPQFRPEEPITRAEFITWLVRAFNIYYPNRQMRLGPSPNFSDTVNNAPYSRYVGAIQDAGYVVGFEDGTFRPAENLTREQMVTIKTRLETDSVPTNSVEGLRNGLSSQFDDTADMDAQFVPFIVQDNGSFGGRNFQRIYGTTRNYRPKQAVTRAEAAVLLSRFGIFSIITSEQALRRLAQ